MAGDVGGLEWAAGTWLSRLRKEDKLPAKSTLEALRRREAAARQRAEAESELERRYAAMCTDRLDDERRLTAERMQAATEARSALNAERSLRADAEVRLSQEDNGRKQAELALFDERARREGAERSLQHANSEISELRALVADDQALRALDEFSAKFDTQRNQIAVLQQQLEMQRGTGRSAQDSLDRVTREFGHARQDWDQQRLEWLRERTDFMAERDRLIVERDAALADYALLHDAGVTLQVAAESALTSAAEAEDLQALQWDSIATSQVGVDEFSVEALQGLQAFLASVEAGSDLSAIGGYGRPMGCFGQPHVTTDQHSLVSFGADGTQHAFADGAESLTCARSTLYHDGSTRDAIHVPEQPHQSLLVEPANLFAQRQPKAD